MTRKNKRKNVSPLNAPDARKSKGGGLVGGLASLSPKRLFKSELNKQLDETTEQLRKSNEKMRAYREVLLDQEEGEGEGEEGGATGGESTSSGKNSSAPRSLDPLGHAVASSQVPKLRQLHEKKIVDASAGGDFVFVDTGPKAVGSAGLGEGEGEKAQGGVRNEPTAATYQLVRGDRER